MNSRFFTMNKFTIKVLGLVLVLICSGCSFMGDSQVSQSVLANDVQAKVLQVKITGKPGNYNFTVTVSSPDTGCDRYADWWEVVTPEGELLYRRVLLHSHVDEQPFTRGGGKVAIESEQEVIVRVHMSPDGYSPLANKGSVEAGFVESTLPVGFAADLATVEPLPKNCAF